MTEVPSATASRTRPNSSSTESCAERSGRLVEDEQLRPDRQRLGDLEQVLLGHAQRFHAVVQVHCNPTPASSARAVAAREAPPSKNDAGSATRRFSSTVRSGSTAGCWCTIAMPRSRRFARDRGCRCSPFEHHRAGVRLDHAGGDVHQRRLAGAVLAEQGVHLAGQNLERDVLQRGDAGEALGDAGHGQRRDDGGRFGGLGVHGPHSAAGCSAGVGLPGRQPCATREAGRGGRATSAALPAPRRDICAER